MLTNLIRTGFKKTLDTFYDQIQTRLQGLFETLNTSASTLTVGNCYHTKLVTSGLGTTQNATVGATGEFVGQRKLVTLLTRTHASDVVSLNHANWVNAAGTQLTNLDLGAAGKFVLGEWNGTKWQIVYSDATVATS